MFFDIYWHFSDKLTNLCVKCISNELSGIKDSWQYITFFLSQHLHNLLTFKTSSWVPTLILFFSLSLSLEADGKVVDGLLGDANGVEPAPGRAKDSGKWQKPRFSRKALMKCCLVKWIIASTQPQDKGEEDKLVVFDVSEGLMMWWLHNCLNWLPN